MSIKCACVLVHKIITDDICVALQGHFKKHARNKTKSNNNNNNSKFAENQHKIYLSRVFFTWRLSYIATCVRTAENRKSFMGKLDFFLKTK